MTKSGGAQTYAEAGVDLDAAARAKLSIRELTERTLGSGVVSGPGGFGGIYDPDPNGSIYLVSSTDSVGTKLRIAQAMGKHDTVGIDIVNHCVNDILPSGARPLFFLDYIGLGELDEELISGIVSGLAAACVDAGCALIGGETATLPGTYRDGDYDLVGFIVGSVNKSDVLSPNDSDEGDALLAIPSSGLHTNGYTLVRSVFGIDEDASALDDLVPGDERSLGEALLAPHRSYLDVLLPVMDRVKSLAHITGGGFRENVPRALRIDLAAELDLNSWDPPPLFRHIQNSGAIDDLEMFNVFNMGIGMIAVVSSDDVESVKNEIEGSWVVGRTTKYSGTGERVKLV